MQSSIPGHLGECAGLVLLPPWRSLPLPQPPSCVGSCSSPSRPVGGRERADVLITWKLRITLEMKGTWREGGVKSPLRKETRLRNNSHKEASPMQSFTLAKGGRCAPVALRLSRCQTCCFGILVWRLSPCPLPVWSTQHARFTFLKHSAWVI